MREARRVVTFANVFARGNKVKADARAVAALLGLPFRESGYHTEFLALCRTNGVKVVSFENNVYILERESIDNRNAGDIDSSQDGKSSPSYDRLYSRFLTNRGHEESIFRELFAYISNLETRLKRLENLTNK